jgi:hypothetical protein
VPRARLSAADCWRPAADAVAAPPPNGCPSAPPTVLGGLSLKVQEAELRSRPDIVVATPGRLIDLLRNTHSFDLEDLEVRSWPRRALLIALDCV